jgi:hypothetical protein
MPRAELRAARASGVFYTDEKHIRVENTVMDKSKGGLGLHLSKDRRLRTDGFWSVRNRRSARTGRRPRKSDRRSSRHRLWIKAQSVVPADVFRPRNIITLQH